MVMDGVGVGRGDAYDAVAAAHTPNLKQLQASGRYRTLRAHGQAVGLPTDADMGNSEVGHNILGAGRIFDQGAKRVNEAIAAGATWTSKAWLEVLRCCAGTSSTLHLVGLLSDGNVHSHIDHLEAIIARAVSDGISRVRLHALFDGRDVPDHTAGLYVDRLRTYASRFPDLDFAFASGGGRMVTTMDRYGADWRIVEAGWRAHVLGTAHPVHSVDEGIEWSRSTRPGISDQLLPPFTVVGEDGAPVGKFIDGDAVIFFNFRGDRAIEFSQAIESGPEFTHFDRGGVPAVFYLGMLQYDGDTNTPRHYLVEPQSVANTVSELISRVGLRQWAGAETQKFGHITYFWNGNRSDKFDDATETYVEIPSDQVPFDERPWMKSAETADAAMSAISSGMYEFIRLNFAGPDMVGHTANFEAIRIAVESVDLAIGRIAKAAREVSGCLIVTADHGNAEDKVERSADGNPATDRDGNVIPRNAHSLNPVPFIVKDFARPLLELRHDLPDAGLANVAATVLSLLGLEVPLEYEPGLVAG
ncbi:MAG: 2,3-bisphosphoglycerate-independent phosphoglycerate mutase [Acidimicrobiales bacterium]